MLRKINIPFLLMLLAFSIMYYAARKNFNAYKTCHEAYTTLYKTYEMHLDSIHTITILSDTLTLH